MKTYSFSLLIFLAAFSLNAQDDFMAQWNAAYELASTQKYDEAIAAFEPLLTQQPAYAETHVQMAWCYLMKSQMEEAGERVQTAYQLDPLSPSVYAINSYFMYVSGYPDAGKVFLNDAAWFMPNDKDLALIQQDIDEMKSAGLDVSSLESDYKTIMATIGDRNKNWANIQTKFFEAVDLLNEGDNVAAKATFKEMFPMFEGVPEAQQRFVYNLTYVVGTNFYNVGDSSNYLPLLTRSYEQMLENSKTSYVPILHMNTLLSEHFYQSGDYQKAFEYASNGLTQYTSVYPYRFLGAIKAQFLSQYAAAALAVGNLQEGRDAGNLITELNYTGFDEWYEINGLLYMAYSWAEDETKAQEYYQQAYDLAEANGFEDLKNSIADNLK